LKAYDQQQRDYTTMITDTRVIKVIDVVPSATYQEDAKDHKLICLNG
jgi:hypothetical protein